MEQDGTTLAAAATEGASTPQTKTTGEALVPTESNDTRVSTQPAIPPPALTAVASPAPQGSESTVARKLRELQQLRQEGLISEDEYDERRKAVLSAM